MSCFEPLSTSEAYALLLMSFPSLKAPLCSSDTALFLTPSLMLTFFMNSKRISPPSKFPGLHDDHNFWAETSFHNLDTPDLGPTLARLL